MSPDHQPGVQIPELNLGEPRITLAPLVDVVFLLLIFFVVTTVFPENRAIKIDKPSSTSASSVTNRKFILTVTKEERIFYKNKTVDENDISRLVKTFLIREPNGVIFLQVDRAVTTQTLIHIMDLCKAGGAQQLALAASDDSANR